MDAKGASVILIRLPPPISKLVSPDQNSYEILVGIGYLRRLVGGRKE